MGETSFLPAIAPLVMLRPVNRSDCTSVVVWHFHRLSVPSSDPVDGIGAWTPADLANALVAGVSPRGEHYYPAFPYPSYTGMSIADVRDLFAFLKTLPPVSGRAPPHHPSVLFIIRRSVGFWKLSFSNLERLKQF